MPKDIELFLNIYLRPVQGIGHQKQLCQSHGLCGVEMDWLCAFNGNDHTITNRCDRGDAIQSLVYAVTHKPSLKQTLLVLKKRPRFDSWQPKLDQLMLFLPQSWDRNSLATRELL